MHPPYRPLLKPNQLAYGTGTTLVVCGWTPKDYLVKKLDPSSYAAIGQLYSRTSGIDVLLRNLLANPQCHTLAVYGATREDRNAGATKALLDFFKRGYRLSEDDGHWEINTTVPDTAIGRDIPAEALDSLRQTMVVFGCEDLTDLKHFLEMPEVFLGHRKKLELIPELVLPKIKPGPRYGHRIEGRTVAETWVKILHRIKTTGTIRPTGYDGHWQELIDLVAIVTDEPPEGYFPEPNYLPHDRKFLQDYWGQILSDAPVREGVKYTYGQRMRSWFGQDQIQQVIDKLVGEIDAASAVINLWDPEDHIKGGSPCLNHIWVRVIDGELSLTATFRSNDMFGAWPANAQGLRALQQHILEEIQAIDRSIELRLGPLITNSLSAHIYDNCWENTEELIQRHYLTQRKTFEDPVGNFVINVASDGVNVALHSPKGTVAGVWVGTNAPAILRRITQELPQLQVSHAAYLGSEVQRACMCFLEGNTYEQDRG